MKTHRVLAGAAVLCFIGFIAVAWVSTEDAAPTVAEEQEAATASQFKMTKASLEALAEASANPADVWKAWRQYPFGPRSKLDAMKKAKPAKYTKAHHECKKLRQAASRKCAKHFCQARKACGVACQKRILEPPRMVIPLKRNALDKQSPLFYKNAEVTHKEQHNKEQKTKELAFKQDRARREVLKERQAKEKQAKEHMSKERTVKATRAKEKRKKESQKKELAIKVHEDKSKESKHKEKTRKLCRNSANKVLDACNRKEDSAKKEVIAKKSGLEKKAKKKQRKAEKVTKEKVFKEKVAKEDKNKADEKERADKKSSEAAKKHKNNEKSHKDHAKATADAEDKKEDKKKEQQAKAAERAAKEKARKKEAAEKKAEKAKKEAAAKEAAAKEKVKKEKAQKESNEKAGKKERRKKEEKSAKHRKEQKEKATKKERKEKEEASAKAAAKRKERAKKKQDELNLKERQRELHSKERRRKEEDRKEKSAKEGENKKTAERNKKAQQREAQQKAAAEKKKKTPKKEYPTTGTSKVSGLPCNHNAGPICQGYNLRCFRSGTLHKCKVACAKRSDCNVAEFTKRSRGNCCLSKVATKAACRGRWNYDGGWVGYTVCHHGARSAGPLYSLVKRNAECNSSDKWLGRYSNVAQCAAACERKSGCKTFVFGFNDKRGKCYQEYSDYRCRKGWEKDRYNFYKMNHREEADEEEETSFVEKFKIVREFGKISKTNLPKKHPIEWSRQQEQHTKATAAIAKGDAKVKKNAKAASKLSAALTKKATAADQAAARVAALRAMEKRDKTFARKLTKMRKEIKAKMKQEVAKAKFSKVGDCATQRKVTFTKCHAKNVYKSLISEKDKAKHAFNSAKKTKKEIAAAAALAKKQKAIADALAKKLARADAALKKAEVAVAKIAKKAVSAAKKKLKKLPKRIADLVEVGGHAFDLKYKNKWPHCRNIKCMSASVEKFKAACLRDDSCDGFSFTAGKKVGGGCLKQSCVNDGHAGYGHGSHGYYEKLGHLTRAAAAKAQKKARNTKAASAESTAKAHQRTNAANAADKAKAAAHESNNKAQSAAHHAEQQKTKELQKKKLTKAQMASVQKAFEAKQKKIVAQKQQAAARKLAARIAAIKKTLHSKNAAALNKQVSKANAKLSKHKKELKKQASVHAAQNARLRRAAAAIKKHKELVAKDNQAQRAKKGKEKAYKNFWRNKGTGKCKTITGQAHKACQALLNGAYTNCKSMFDSVKRL